MIKFNNNRIRRDTVEFAKCLLITFADEMRLCRTIQSWKVVYIFMIFEIKINRTAQPYKTVAEFESSTAA